ncbi:conserved Plasmodium protein, unknown function [Plasmodium knowlesi strain H]|uniref:Uncharacterized protein n=3 Tax=Plasmodium knowlesi TaxID=5850 RepID=A0A5K1UYZ1_PLAKH|nr:conserved Plasmodium protein, unknown function [Plasmodium knowlesi strain H]OTN67002.1 Uncharacterized protein PKNOH_S07447100 [Plasmodium knowlesi]CAA9988598.1 conserved Plasmodium protein, unknown function [Plasmodium knowlesi strain H]SBO21424.1 conserved Plasmodium protein, unknown function [Plasmodium knowlesi strain H]SBO21872.1 conserved Plasmodium protein, unknown function [Plasmodium knowlesi strain H]VVS78072.1 conserved Plasmodium protein, unknown function [Plasmodium knowlesi s|eukprot:XP_002259574.1 hypothetical protein, conserved in Plasmodium species [Plasmodium knowlesi strain H]
MILMSFLNGTKIIWGRRKEKSFLLAIFKNGKNVGKSFTSSSGHTSKGVSENVDGKERFIQLRHSDSATRYQANGIMKTNNWPKKKISKKKNELYIFMKKTGNKTVDFHQLNIVLTKKIGEMQNFNEVYKLIYYNKCILVPLNYVVCVYRMYKLAKQKECKIVNYQMHLNSRVEGLSIDELCRMASLDQVNDYGELSQRLSMQGVESTPIRSSYRNGEGRDFPQTERTPYMMNPQEQTRYLCFDYKNDILQHILNQINKNYFVKMLTYRHLSNLLFALINLKYYDIATYLMYVKHIINMYVHLSSQAIANVTYSYALLFSFYSIDFTVCYENYMYKYYMPTGKGTPGALQHDHINLMFLLLSRWMCMKTITYINGNFKEKYDMDSFYKGVLSNTEELNEREKKYNLQFGCENPKHERKKFFQEFFIFLWSVSKLKINNIYIDLMLHTIHQNRKYVFPNFNEKDICNYIQSVCIYYPLKKLSQTCNSSGNSTSAVSLGNETPLIIFDYDALLRSTLLCTLFHLKKCSYQHYAIIFKCLRNLQNVGDTHNGEGITIWDDPMSSSLPCESKSGAHYSQLDHQSDFSSENYSVHKKGEEARPLYFPKTNSLQNILKKLANVVVRNLLTKLKSRNDGIFYHVNYCKRSSTLNLQHLSVYLYNLSLMNEFYVEDKAKKELTQWLISILEKGIKRVHYSFDNKSANVKLEDNFLQQSYDNLVCLGNINYALNKSNIINESLIIHSAVHFFKMYHVFYKEYKNSERTASFFNFLQKINERVLSIFNWTFSHTGVAFMPLFTLINYHYLYLLYVKDASNMFVLLKKILLPMTIYNNITLYQMRLILKLLINYYMSHMVNKREGDTNYMNHLDSIHDDVLTCMYSLSLIITNISHNIRSEKLSMEGNTKPNSDKSEYVYFYINVAHTLLRSYFYHLYSLNAENIRRHILCPSKNEDTLMKFYTFYLFVKINMNKHVHYDRNVVKKFVSSSAIPKKGFYFFEKLLTSFSEQKTGNWGNTEDQDSDSFAHIDLDMKEGVQMRDGSGKEAIDEELNEENRTVDNYPNQRNHARMKGNNNKDVLPLYVNNIDNRNYSPRENLGIFYLIQKSIYPKEIKMNKRNLLFLKQPNVSQILFNPRVDKELRKVEERVLLTFKQIESSKSHIKIYNYINHIYEQKRNARQETFPIQNEYVVNKDNTLFVVDIYDKNTNTIFEIDGISHYTKQYTPNKSMDSFSFFYNYKSYYIFKHLILRENYNIVHLPLHDSKLCRNIICNYYKATSENG